MLADWKRRGFAKAYGRAPKPDDFVVPNRTGKRRMHHRLPGTSLHAHTLDCENIGIVPRRDHDLRHTFVSLARGDGAHRDMLEKVTHNAKGEMIDHYTHVDFEPKCRAVAALRIDLSASGGPCWPPEYHALNHASGPPGSANQPVSGSFVATPTGIEPVLPT